MTSYRLTLNSEVTRFFFRPHHRQPRDYRVNFVTSRNTLVKRGRYLPRQCVPCFLEVVRNIHGRDDSIRQGLALVDACYRIATVTRAEVFALENPVGKLRKWIGEPVMRFQPNQYAGWADDPATEAYTKRTLLFGWFNTELEKREVDPGRRIETVAHVWRQIGTHKGNAEYDTGRIFQGILQCEPLTGTGYAGSVDYWQTARHSRKLQMTLESRSNGFTRYGATVGKPTGREPAVTVAILWSHRMGTVRHTRSARANTSDGWTT